MLCYIHKFIKDPELRIKNKHGSDAELKRRMTRAGEPVAVKLAQDIHSIRAFLMMKTLLQLRV